MLNKFLVFQSNLYAQQTFWAGLSAARDGRNKAQSGRNCQQLYRQL